MPFLDGHVDSNKLFCSQQEEKTIKRVFRSTKVLVEDPREGRGSFIIGTQSYNVPVFFETMESFLESEISFSKVTFTGVTFLNALLWKCCDVRLERCSGTLAVVRASFVKITDSTFDELDIGDSSFARKNSEITEFKAVGNEKKWEEGRNNGDLVMQFDIDGNFARGSQPIPGLATRIVWMNNPWIFDDIVGNFGDDVRFTSRMRFPDRRVVIKVTPRMGGLPFAFMEFGDTPVFITNLKCLNQPGKTLHILEDKIPQGTVIRADHVKFVNSAPVSGITIRAKSVLFKNVTVDSDVTVMSGRIVLRGQTVFNGIKQESSKVTVRR